MKNIFIPIYIILFSFISGCIPPTGKNIDPNDLKIISSGELEWVKNQETTNAVYINIKDKTGKAQNLQIHAQLWLEQKGLKITNNPSNAGHIIQISLLNAGLVDPESISSLVKEGYGGESHFSGEGTTAILADVLLVARKVPNAKNIDKAKLQNISSRNAISSTQIRVGIYVEGNVKLNKGLPEYFSQALAKEIGKNFIE